MAVTFYPVTIVAKPRMTRRDKWKARPVVLRYRAFKDECKIFRVQLDVTKFYHVIALMPVPASLNDIERRKRIFEPHSFTPDKDNLEKALLDALYSDDSIAWDGRFTKVWAGLGGMFISDKNMDVTPSGIHKLVGKYCGAVRSTLNKY